MKKHLTLLICSFIFLFMFGGNGSLVKAAENSSSEAPQMTADLAESSTQSADCGCNVEFINGAERNKIVASLLSSDDFKQVKMEAKQEGYQWLGANAIEVIHFIAFDVNLIGVPFKNTEGVKVYVFSQDGQLLYTDPE